MLGYNYSESTINQCFTSAVVDGALYAGGFAGMDSWYSVISNSCSIGPVSGIDRVGGFIGNEGYGSKAESFALGDVTSTGTNAGGFIGLTFDTSEVNDSYSRGNVPDGEISMSGDLSGIIIHLHWQTAIQLVQYLRLQAQSADLLH